MTPDQAETTQARWWGWLFARGASAHVFVRTRVGFEIGSPDLIESLCGRSIGNPRWLYGPKARPRCVACMAILARREMAHDRAA